MSDCCQTSSLKATAADACPDCDMSGKPVDVLTVKALLREQALARLQPVAHRFCATSDCPVVYFDEAGQTFATQDLRVEVWQKGPPGRRIVCYCFGENEAEIRREIERSGESNAVARVRAHIAAGRCACEVRNPRGACCLGDLTQAVNRVVSLEADPVVADK